MRTRRARACQPKRHRRRFVCRGRGIQGSAPFRNQAVVHDRLMWAVFAVLTFGPTASQEHRRKEVARWKRRGVELDTTEKKMDDTAYEAVNLCWSNGWMGARQVERQADFAVGRNGRGSRSTASHFASPLSSTTKCGEVPRSGLYSRKTTTPTKTMAGVLQRRRWQRTRT